MNLSALSLYRPVWEQGAKRLAGHDEDVVTLAVAAARPLAEQHPVNRVVIVTPAPDVLEGFGLGVVSRALDLAEWVPMELRVGGADAAIAALVDATFGTLVVGVDLSDQGAAAGAAFVSEGDGAVVTAAGRAVGSLPMRVRHVGVPSLSTYGDARVEREMGSAPLVERFRGEGATHVVGLSASESRRLGATPLAVPTQGAAGVIFALAAICESATDQSVRLLGLDSASVCAVDVQAAHVDVVRDERPGIPVAERPTVTESVEIPFSMPAYARAFEAKVALLYAACECGAVSFPPREHCLNCAAVGATELRPLARTGEIYTCVKVHVPIPGITGPYGLAIVSVDNSPIRVLAHVADVGGREAAIGERGHLVLRRVAIREGVPDYGYGFRSDVDSESERKSA